MWIYAYSQCMNARSENTYWKKQLMMAYVTMKLTVGETLKGQQRSDTHVRPQKHYNLRILLQFWYVQFAFGWTSVGTARFRCDQNTRIETTQSLNFLFRAHKEIKSLPLIVKNETFYYAGGNLGAANSQALLCTLDSIGTLNWIN